MTLPQSQPLDGNGRTIEFDGWDSANNQYVVDEAGAGTAATGQPFSYAPKKVQISSANSGLPANLPAIAQKAAGASTGSVASLAQAFTNANKAGNSIVVVCAVGNNTAPTVADLLGNTYTQAALVARSTTFETAIFYAVNVLAGANTVTVTNAGSTASMAVEIYEVSGLIAQVTAQPDQTATANGSSGTAATAAVSPSSPNELAFAGVAVGTAAQTITPATGWTNDSGQQNPATPAGFYSFISMSQFLGSLAPVTPQATFTSEPWAIAAATFRPVVLGIEGTVGLAVGGTAVPSGHGTAANAMRVELPTDGTGVVGLNAGSNTIGSVSSVSGTKATYTYAVSATAPYATPTDWIVIRGSGTKTVKILRVEISGAATAATEVIFTLKKHTIANTSGTSSTPTPMQHDSNDGAATAVVLLYSVAPTIDASATIWKNVRLTLAVAPAATTVAPDRYVYDYGVESYEPLTLRGVAQEFAINFGGSAVPSGGVYDVAIVLSEE